MSKIYEVATINTGGRSGKIYSQEKKFLYDVAAPGTQNTDATNPEELFAAAKRCSPYHGRRAAQPDFIPDRVY